MNRDARKTRAVASKALIAADANYYAWPRQKQERFRATMDAAAIARVESVLLNELAGVRCIDEEVDEVWSSLPAETINLLKWAKLLATGIGDDMVVLNESMATGTSLLDFETLYDFDFDDHLYQQSTSKEQFPDYSGRAYQALRFSKWVCLDIDQKFYYATLYSLSDYLTESLETSGNEIIDALIPHQFVEGEHHGKEEDGGTRWDIRVDAHGLEGQLRTIAERWHRYLEQRREELSLELEQLAPAVHIEDESTPDENHRNFIFNNAEALKRIRWKHFLADCSGIEESMAPVTARLNNEKRVVEEWIKATHADVMANFDPAVVKLRQRRKVIIAPGALKGLEDGDE